MSYILEALKKAELESNPQVQVAAITPPSATPLALPWKLLIGAVVLLNLALIYLWRSDRSQAVAPVVTAPAPALVPAPLVPAPVVPQPVTQAVPKTPKQTPRKTLPGLLAPRTSTPAPRPASRILQLDDLSSTARAEINDLNFSTHIYGVDADLRAVVLNGKRLIEGQAQGKFELLQILEDGVVLRFVHAGKSLKVEIPLLEDWQL